MQWGGYASHAEIINVPENLAVRVSNFENQFFTLQQPFVHFIAKC